jgi:hypothetical protein
LWVWKKIRGGGQLIFWRVVIVICADEAWYDEDTRILNANKRILDSFQGTGRPGAPMFRSLRSFVRDGRLNRALAVPAFLYSINSQLKFAMQLFFKPTTAKMLGNLKAAPPPLLLLFIMFHPASLPS